MPLFDFRIRFNLPEAYRINSEADKIELLALSPGERISLVSGSSAAPIKKHNHAAVVGKSFTSEDEARNAAERAKRALLYWTIEQRLGIDFGDGKQRSGVTKAGLNLLERNWGCTVRNDIHGIDVYEHVENMKFALPTVKAEVGKAVAKLVDTFQREYATSRNLRDKEVLASEIYASSLFDVSARSRFITLVTAVEALLEPAKRSSHIEALVEEFKAKTSQSVGEEATRDSIVGSLGRLKYQSIRQAGRALANRLLPDEVFDGQESGDFFTRAYDVRSTMLHTGAVPHAEGDISHLANVMESFVNRLLLKALNSEAQQGSNLA